MSVLSRTRLRASAVLLALLTSLGLVGSITPAQAATTYQNRIVIEASHHAGKPYQYGATGPSPFDCSGFTKYVFARMGKTLPRSSSQQYAAVRHIPKASKQIGDLIFIKNSSGRIYHVGIYAGGGYWWHAPKSGDVVKKAKIWTSSYVVGRR